MVAHVAVSGHFRRDIDGGREDFLVQLRPQQVRIFDAVLQADDHRVGFQERGHLRGCLNGIGALDAAQHHVGIFHAAARGACLEPDILVE